MPKEIKVLVCGAAGKMGKSVVKAVTAETGFKLVSAVDRRENPDIGKDIGIISGIDKVNVKLSGDLKEAISKTSPDVMVDFTMPEIVFTNTEISLKSGVRAVVGTTGMSKEDINELAKIAKQNGIGAVVAPNFAIGAVLMMRFAKDASKYFDNAEIIEFHGHKKLDAPSGTAIKTAELMTEARKEFGKDTIKGKETFPGARGSKGPGNLHIHSVRLPSLVAHQEVILAGLGQTLTIRHDSFDRTSFMPGVLMAIKKVMQIDHLIYGLENII
ncbi:MAG: 4-hydroxy-tetrahydrodipicolinate reductase [Candidatus Melainabacteria bacterium]|nr:4-hydroxy-tetrahydrodipicolinate reductase [Candidatus Melainabacteria bacterium]MBI3307955.1 4-hydroxy-tetrahydrodipicolinate reductase [Candidatus Melainabacteria bacterium]